MKGAGSRRLGGLGVAAAGAFVLVYVLALGTDPGRDLDAWVLPASPRTEPGAHHHTARENALSAMADVALLLGLIAVVVAVLHRRSLDRAAIALVSTLGACASAYVLKPLLSRADPLGGEADRALEAAFPSGHATAAMALALVAVVVVPPRMRTWVAGVGAAFAALMGIGLVAASFHYPSDVLGGYLLAAAWVAATAAIGSVRRERFLAPLRNS